MIGPYLSTVLDYYQKGRWHAGRHGKIWGLFGNEENVKQVALETLFYVLGLSDKSQAYNRLAAAIARRAEYVLWLNHPDMKNWHVQGLKLASNSDLGMGSICKRLKSAGFAKAAGYVSLGKLERTALGAFFIEAICASTQLFSVEIDYDHDNRKFKSVQPTDRYWDFLKRWKHNLMMFRHANMPMLVPPKPYTDYSDGGYLSIESAWVKIAWERYPMFMENAHPCVLGTINKLQSTPFSLDHDQLGLIQWAWDTGHEIGSVPRAERVPRVFFSEAKERYGDASKAWREIWKQRNDWRKDAFRKKIVNTFIACNQLKEYGPYFCVWQSDTRGRLYPRSGQISYAGADPHRSLFMFGVAAPIKGNEREFAWAVGDAIGLPVDRAAREHWLTLSDLACRIGENPHETLSLWADVKKPWRYVQLCREWSRYVSDPGYCTSLPFQLDQTTSGYGHVACLTRDDQLAEWTNVIGDSPQDLYSRVAAKVQEVVKEQYSSCEDEDYRKRYLKWWLNNWPGRSLFKPAIMPIIYGRRYTSLQAQIAEALVIQFSHSQSPEGHQAAALASVMARSILAGARLALPRVLSLNRWLSAVGRGMLAKDQRPYWHTPNGLKIESYNSITRKKRMALMLSGRTVSVQIRDGEGEPLKGSTAHICADFIHSLDAAFLQRFVHGWQHEIVTVHDCFATTLDKVVDMRRQLNETFRDFYRADHLLDLYRRMAEQEGLAIPPPPNLQTLDPERIGENPFLFS
jgi:DNA-directed RNA polymerase